MLSLIVPCYSAGPDLTRTVESTRGLCDDVVIISTAIFDDEPEMARHGRVVSLPWNFVFQHGFGELHNQGTAAARNDWLLLFGVAETFAEPYVDIAGTLKASPPDRQYRCNHCDDPNTWNRIWNKNGPCRWSGLIHEDIVGGIDGGVIFRFADTHKTPHRPEFEMEVLRYVKLVAYQNAYLELIQNPSRLGGTHPSWLRHLEGSKKGLWDFAHDHFDLLFCARTGDKRGFIAGVKKRFEEGKRASGVKYDPVGEQNMGLDIVGLNKVKDDFCRKDFNERCK